MRNSNDDLTAFQLENAYISFCAGAYLACIVMCQASIESYIRDDEYLDSRTFYDLINGCSYSDEMKAKLHHLRMYRNKWTHIHIGENNDFHIYWQEDNEVFRQELLDINKKYNSYM